MDFNEFWENGCFGEYHDIYTKNLADKFYQAGQQSKQAKIDALEEKLKKLQAAYDDCTEYTTISELLDSIKEILK